MLSMLSMLSFSYVVCARRRCAGSTSWNQESGGVTRRLSDTGIEFTTNREGRVATGASSHCAHRAGSDGLLEYLDWRPDEYFTWQISPSATLRHGALDSVRGSTRSRFD